MSTDALTSFRTSRGLPTSPEAYPHGTRARYVVGCRCAPCRASNAARMREREREARILASELSVASYAAAPQLWTAPDGSKRVRTYARACPGVLGQPCAFGSHLRRDSGLVCRRCRLRLVWAGVVPADPARRHLAKLSRQGVGFKSVADAASVARTVVLGISTGRRKRIRASTERRILAVDREAVAGGGLVSAAPTWKRIGELLEEGFTKAELARRLGYARPALQLGRGRITARNAARVERFYRLINLE